MQRHRKKDGSTIVVEIEANPGLLDGRAVQVVLANDVTAKLTLEEHLRQTQKMEAVGQLAGGVAHDFNNMITVIDAHAQFLGETLGSSDPGHEDVVAIRHAAHRAAGLTSQLLAFSRKQILRPRLLDPCDVVRRAEGMLRRLIGEDIMIEIELAEGVGFVLADAGQLEQVLMNLAVNARDAMPLGGTLRIMLHRGQSIGSGLSPIGGSVAVLAVSDTGHGMDEATRKRIFEPFFTTKGVGKGTGLGLATVYGIVEQSGGHITCSSEVGRGTTFEVHLPLAARRPDVEAQDVPSPLLPGSETILVVEDEAPLRQIARRVLARQGYRVLEAASGDEAVQLVGTRGGEIDLVLVDMVMPGMSGRALGERLPAIGCSAPVLYMSGYTDDEILRRGLLRPGLAFLQKPFTVEGLVQAVRDRLDSAVVRA